MTRPLAKPPVRKLAKDLGVDLASVVPTGKDGIITREDVHAAAAPAEGGCSGSGFPPPDPVTAEPSAAPVLLATARETRIPIKGVRTGDRAGDGGQRVHRAARHGVRDGRRDAHDEARGGATKEDKDMAGVRVNPLLIIAKALLVAIKRNPRGQRGWDEANQEIVQSTTSTWHRGRHPRAV